MLLRPSACVLGVAVTLASGWAAAQDLELTLHGGGFVVAEPDEQLAPVGLVGGVTPLLRLSSHFAVGMKLEYARLGWDALGASQYVEPGMMFPDPDGAYRSTLVAGVGRAVILSAAGFEPYVQLALGHLAFREDPEHPDCHFESPFGVQLAVGLDFALARWARLGAFGTAQPFPWALSCNEIGYESRPPDPPYPGIALAGQAALTTVWSLKRN